MLQNFLSSKATTVFIPECILGLLVIFIVLLFIYLFHMHFNLVTRLWLDLKEAPHFEVQRLY